MKLAVACLLVAAVVQGRPQGDAASATLLKYEFNNNEDGGYSYSWESSDGIAREETAEVVNAGAEDEYLFVRGSYSYPGPDGNVYSVAYTSDVEGFQPEGDHIPPAAGVKKKPQLGIPSAALASLAGGGLG